MFVVNSKFFPFRKGGGGKRKRWTQFAILVVLFVCLCEIYVVSPKYCCCFVLNINANNVPSICDYK